MSTITKCSCGGRMVPMTDGNGGVTDKCAVCGSRDGNGKPPSLNGVTIRARVCAVDGCPGAIDANGQCPCCVKRAKWEEANRPTRPCGICGGQYVGRANAKYCKACAVIVNRVSVASEGDRGKSRNRQGALSQRR